MIQMHMKKMFFDRPAVMAAVESGTRDMLAKAGHKVMLNARQSLREATNDKPSKPGRPPKSRHGLLKKLLYFAYDPIAKGVVIGPEYRRINNHLNNGQMVIVGEQPGPSLLEHGGSVKVRQKFVRGRWINATPDVIRRNPGATSRVVTLPVKPRPYMQPALDKYLRREHKKNLQNLLRKGV